MNAQDFINQAKAVKDRILVHPQMLNGEIYCLQVADCQDFDDYKKLPKIIEFQGVFYKKTGWNSDTAYCTYKATNDVAKIVRKR